MRLLKWLVFLLLLGVGGYFAYQPVSKWLAERSKVLYRTAKVTKGPIESVVNSTGTVKPVRSVTIGAFVSGPIAEIKADFNQEVKKGQLLARIDPRLQTAALERDKASLDTAKAELARVDALLQQAKNNEERARKLLAVNKDYLSDVELDQLHFTRLSLEAQRQLALANISQAEAQLKNSSANLQYTEITSPVDGIVIERKVDPGQTVASAFQTPELFIVAPDMDKHMHVFASVDEADIGLIRKAQERNQPVKFTVDAYPDELFEGTIHQVRKSSTTTQNVVTYPVVIEAPNPDLKLFPGMTANISFMIETKKDVLRVPVSALRFYPVPAQIRPQDRHYLENAPSREQPEQDTKQSASEKHAASAKRHRRVVWVQDGLFLRAVPVVLGLMDNQGAELLEGDLKDGQEIVVGIDLNIPAAGSR